jgi:hypothetical protein
VRRGVEPDGDAVRLQDPRQQRGGRALSVRPQDQHRRESPLRPAERVQGPLHAVETGQDALLEPRREQRIGP